MAVAEDSGRVIQIDSVNKIFQTEEVETRALADITLEIRAGEYAAITGPSGCGKSTLLSIMGLLDEPTSGSVTIGGVNPERLSRAEVAKLRNRVIGFIFQSFNLIGDLTVFENVELPLKYRRSSASARANRVRETLEKVCMDHRIHHYPAQLSGGQQQRVAVARALVGDPVILLADEPTGNLDSRNGEAIMELLDELNRASVTICMVTHDPRYVDRARRTLVLFDGRLTDDSTKGL